MENDELAQYLDALEREECYRVDEVLRASPHETTERVFFVGANGSETGPFIRKFIHLDSGLGGAYERIYEAQRAGRRFAHLPQIHECYMRDDQMVVVMEYVQGETLQELVYREDPSMDLALSVFGNICDAVSELHEGFRPAIIHRDLKPSNIILSGSNVTIIDFGIAREYKATADADTMQFGTRAYAPPEQFGFGQTTVRSDVYALGMILYFCLTEKIPDANVRTIGFDDPRIPPAMKAVLLQATAFDPEHRFANARALKAAFEHAVNNPEQSGPVAAGTAAPVSSATVAAGIAAGVAYGTQHAVGTAAPRVAAAQGAAPVTMPLSPDATNAQSTVSANPTPRSPYGTVLTTPILHSSNQIRPVKSDRQTGGKIWNGFLVFFVFYMVLFSFGHASNPAQDIAEYGPVYIAYMYCFAMPLLLAGFAWVVYDKRRLGEHFPKLKKIPWWVWAAGFIGLIFVVCAIAAVIMRVAG